MARIRSGHGAFVAMAQHECSTAKLRVISGASGFLADYLEAWEAWEPNLHCASHLIRTQYHQFEAKLLIEFDGPEEIPGFR